MNNEIIQIISIYGYPMLLVLTVLEGPIVTMIAAFLASLGHLSIYAVFGLSLFGDIFGDLLYYFLGKHLGFRFVDKFGRYFGINSKEISKISKIFDKYGNKMIFMAKITTGLCVTTFFTAGVVKMRFRDFLKFSILGGLVWTLILVVFGYFFGYMYEEFDNYFKIAKIFTILFAIILFLLIKSYQHKIKVNLYK